MASRETCPVVETDRRKEFRNRLQSPMNTLRTVVLETVGIFRLSVARQGSASVRKERKKYKEKLSLEQKQAGKKIQGPTIFAPCKAKPNPVKKWHGTN